MDKFQIWDMLLKFVPGKSATIAGGAVRDYICGDRPPKDIDIFINIEHDEPYRFGQIPDDVMLKRKANVNVQLNPEYQIDNAGNGVQLIDNFDLNLPDQDGVIPVQCIYVNGSVRNYILKRFDLDICQAWYRKGIISTTAAFNRAHDNSLIGNINGFDGQRTKDHAERIIQRAYQGWGYLEAPVPVVDPAPIGVQAGGWEVPNAAPVDEQGMRLADFIREQQERMNANVQPRAVPGGVFFHGGAGNIRFQVNNEPVQ